MCKNFMSLSEGMINIGISGTDNFGCAITTAHKMPNYQYDCTDPRAPQCFTNNGNNHFNNICIGSVAEKAGRYTYYTLLGMMQKHGLSKKHMFLQIDCEGGEYPGFKYLPVEYLDNIDQIVA